MQQHEEVELSALGMGMFWIWLASVASQIFGIRQFVGKSSWLEFWKSLFTDYFLIFQIWPGLDFRKLVVLS